MVTKKFLQNAYWVEKKSMVEIAQELGISRQAVYYAFLKHRIKTRKRGSWWKEIRNGGNHNSHSINAEPEGK
jgi:hypothetical protein